MRSFTQLCLPFCLLSFFITSFSLGMRKEVVVFSDNGKNNSSEDEAISAILKSLEGKTITGIRKGLEGITVFLEKKNIKKHEEKPIDKSTPLTDKNKRLKSIENNLKILNCLVGTSCCCFGSMVSCILLNTIGDLLE